MRKLIDFKTLEKSKLSFGGFSYFVWRFFGFIGNNFYKKYPPSRILGPSNKRLLNLGAGWTRKKGFVNADFYRFHQQFGKLKLDWMLDITKPLKCKDNFWDGIILEHTNEHISYVDNYHLFCELYRTLKSGGILRLIMPDLDIYLKYKLNCNKSKKMNRYKSLPEAISNLTQSHLHLSTWNYDLLEEVLQEIGFKKIKKVSFMEGSEKELIIDRQSHQWQSLYCEAIK